MTIATQHFNATQPMHRAHPVYRAFRAGACCATAFVFATSARAARDRPSRKDAKSECGTAYESAQERERAGYLREARDLWVACAKAVCGTFLQHECTTRYTQLDSDDIPSVVPLVTDDAGAHRSDVEVRMDGELLTSRLDGQPVSVDPGLHEFSFSAGKGVFAKQQIMIVQGERKRPVSVSMHTASAPAQSSTPPASATPRPTAGAKAPPTERNPDESSLLGKATPGVGPSEDGPGGSRSALPFVLGGAGLLGIGAGAIMIGLGKRDGSAIAANIETGISVGVSVAALAVTIWVFASPRSPDGKPPPGAAYRFDLQPARSGACASIARTF